MIIKTATFIKSAVNIKGMPEDQLTEFMLCGRSNVGKSSFINALVNQKHLAKTSQTPGKTQTLNIYLINEICYFIDVPGYGYAKVSKNLKETFGQMIEEYVLNRKELKRAFLLVDYRHKPTGDDVTMYEFLKYFNIPVTVIATKADKVKNSERVKQKKLIMETLNLSENDKMIITSSETRQGFDLVLNQLDEDLRG